MGNELLLNDVSISDSNYQLLPFHFESNKYQRSELHSAGILCARLCIAIQNRSLGVNVVSKGSPSRIFKVLLISFGITILPKSSTLRCHCEERSDVAISSRQLFRRLPHQCAHWFAMTVVIGRYPTIILPQDLLILWIVL